jgi:hypothetical protein
MLNQFPFSALRSLLSGMQAIQIELDSKTDEEILGELQFELLQRVIEFENICTMFDIEITKCVSRLRSKIQNPLDYKRTVGSFWMELRNRISDELDGKMFFTLTKFKADYYENIIPFGQSVNNSFPSSNFDIEEAAKCFSTSRFTASVMHLQRVLEVGLKGFGLYLGVNLNNPSWGNILNKTQAEIDNRNKTKSWKSSIEQSFSEELQALLQSVKVAWRNPSMHADKQYDEERAQEIFNATKGFMRRLAEHLNEKGKFRKVTQR